MIANVRKVVILYGRCRKKSKKHAARTPVGEGAKEVGIIKIRKVMKKVRKVGIPCGRSRKKSKKHAARAPVGEGGREGGREKNTPQPGRKIV